MQKPMREEAEQPMPEQADSVAPGGGEAAPAEQGGEYEKYAKEALTLMYGDGERFSSMLQMVKAHKSDPGKGIATAAVAIVDQLEKNMGQIPDEQLQKVGVEVVMHLYDLANKAGVVGEPTEQEVGKVFGQALAMWGKKHPDRMDMAELQKTAQQGQPAEQQPTEQAGLLGGMQ